MSKAKPCIVYEEKFDPSSLTQVKLEHNGNTRKVPVFKASAGVEGLFHVIDKFLKAATRLNFQAAELWDQFEDVLDTVAENKWTNLIQNIGGGARNRNRFLREVTVNFVAQYAESENPRDVLIEYIKGDECKKKRKVDPGIHASRIETLCRYANRLEGTEPALNEAQIKKLVFESFPGSWQDDYKKSHRNFQNDTIADIVGYMTLCKAITDKEEERRGKKRKAENPDRIRGGNSAKNKNRNKTGSNTKVSDNDDCPVHGGHKWGVCSLNPRSANWRGGNTNTGRFGGRFQGRFGGRGGGSGDSSYSSHSAGGRGHQSSGGRGSGGRFQPGRGGTAGRGGYHSRGEHSYYYRREGQPNAPQYWTQSGEHYHYGPPPGRGGWHSGSESQPRESPSRYHPNHDTTQW